MDSGQSGRPAAGARQATLGSVSLPVPPSVNSLYANNYGRGKGRYKTAAAKAWEDIAVLLCRAHLPKFSGRVAVTIEIRYAREYDIDNRVKAVLDALQTAERIPNDKVVDRLLIIRGRCTGDEEAIVVVEDFHAEPD